MNIEEDFWNYYYSYLGVEEKDLKVSKLIFKCNQRDKPINNWYLYPLVVTNIGAEFICSISPKYARTFRKFISTCNYHNFEELYGLLDIYFNDKLDDYNIRKMYRLTIEDTRLREFNKSRAIILTREVLMKGLKNTTLKEKQDIWSRKKEEVEQGRQYVILNDENIVSYCKVSNIDFGGGNLVVWTEPEYRGRGYGKEVVIAATKWCIENDILPIYWVDSDNLASLNLAKALNYKIYSEELVVSTNV
ncbi:GNAT family N-acetyltransferase [Clostridium sp. D2Q-14]|uniref:GNAT family N-acetyltransferase n=1 Tax=Anaeromonas gelatinilytica TaxID=2683194 RepID=UPI00193C6F62|nr:GNAT family N-acetyltransferase [Anaeromonas gelatinilytica]MBS4535336.1 GNAT family N-acetyltransferase [Anaeromonas gelatinilytica]